MRRFAAVLAQLKHENMAPVISSIRQGTKISENESSSSSTMAPFPNCRILPKPSYGSYNIAYRALFEDGMEWILKVPANGHHACFDRLAAEALTSEALTMRMIKQTTAIPVPTVHHFDASADNEIGCPYILMDFLKGKPVWQGWFDGEASNSSLEQFRARSLQTIAAAMVQLSQFTLDRGGSLRFDSDGRPVDVAGTKMPDWVADYDALQGLTTLGEDYSYCEKGPTADPASSFLFMLDRRGFREKDGAYDRGIHKALRLFTEWTLEESETVNQKGPQFVLAHPDFALQNFLVEDDGTLCGIIDWDGVAAVPLSIGCLRFPDWLISDWHPRYDYSPGKAGRRKNSPEELGAYRIMYAQFVEAFSSITCRSTKAGKLKADTTRMSLVAGSLALAATELRLIEDAVYIIFEKLKALTADSDDNYGWSVGTDTHDVEEEEKEEEEENSNGDTSPTEVKNSIPGDEESDVEFLCSKCIAEPDQPSPDIVDEETDGIKFPAVDTTSSNGSELEQQHNGVSSSSGGCTEKAADSKEVGVSRKAKVAKWALDLGEKGCRGLSEIFHEAEAPEPKPTRKVRVAKWALALGGKGCKRASEAFHKKEEASGLQSKDFAEAVPAQTNSQSGLKTSKAAICPSIREELLSANIVLVDTEHCQRCNPGKENPGREHQQDGDGTTEMDSEAVWAWIAAEIDRGGIPIELIKKRRKVIAQCLIHDMGQEIEREKEIELHLKDKKAARKGKKARKQAEMTNADHGSNLGSIQDPAFVSPKLIQSKLAETCVSEAEAVNITMPEEWIAEVEDGKTDTTHQSNAILVTQAEGVVIGEVEKPESDPENAAYLEPIIIGTENLSADAIDPDRIGPYKDECGPSEPESLISKLEAAKLRFDTEMALKGQSSGSVSLESENASKAISRLGDAKPKILAHDFATLEAIEEANQKLRMVLSSFAKPEAVNKHLTSNTSQFAEDNDGATEYLGHTKTEGSKQDPTSKAIRLANQKLRMMLLSLQEPEAADTNVQQNIFQVAELEDAEPKSQEGSQSPSIIPISDASPNNVAAQSPIAVKGGQWFETPGGSLKQIEDKDTLDDGSDNQESNSQPDSGSPENNRGSSKTSVDSHGDSGLAEVSDFQLIVPNDNPPETVDICLVPDVDDEDKYNGGERDELEDGEIGEEPWGTFSEFNMNGEELTSKQVGVAEVIDEPNGWEIVDSGRSAFGKMCVALGNGNLDGQRMTRLKKGFRALLDDAVGRHRR